MARKGINKALSSNWQLFENRRLLSDSEYQRNRTCVFISHKKEDAQEAKKLANYIMDSGIDVFFDENDPVLNNPEKNIDPVVVTTAINEALEKSTNMICVVSEKTKESWWVPYEIGYVWNNKGFTHSSMAILILKSITELPEYLFLVEKVDSIVELDSFLKKISNMSYLLNEERYITKSFSDFINHPLKTILK